MRLLAQVFVAQADKLSPSVVLVLVDSNRMVSMRLLGSSLVFSVALVAADVSPGLRGAATEGSDVDGPVGDTFPDLSTGFDIAGPYLEEPSEEEAESPKPSVEGWENSTSLRPEASYTWRNRAKRRPSHQNHPSKDGRIQLRCGLRRPIRGGTLFAKPITRAISATGSPACVVVARPGGSLSVGRRCIPANAAGVGRAEAFPRDARALSAGRTTSASFVRRTTKCIAATTTGISVTARRGQRVVGDADAPSTCGRRR